jgi:hypothetical protein
LLDPKAFLVNRAMMPATQQDEVRECGRPALGPVLDVMSLTERQITAWEAAAMVSIGKRPA